MQRRIFLLKTLLGFGAAPLIAPLASGLELSSDPFTLGIASGDVTANSSVLWTRLAPEPLQADGGMAPVSVPVQWEIAEDAQMSQIVQWGDVLSTPALAHSVHVDVQRLEPGREYWYRFSTGSQRSPIGKTRTLPDGNSQLDSLRFVTASCQNYTHGYFTAYEHMVRDSPDFVIHLGDYIYDTSFGETFRQHETEQAPVTLADFRRRHARYKTDKYLQHAHANLPFFTTIDNHDAIEDMDPDKFAQRAAAYQAWYEHMPVRGYDSIGGNSFDLQRKISISDLLQISLLDSRQFRDKKDLCRESMDSNYGFGNYRESCSSILKQERSMLGKKQEQWLIDNLTQNKSSWNVIASPGPFLPFRYYVDGKELSYIGAWDAYPANRQRIADAIKTAKTGHPIVLSGDVHSFWALDGALTKDVDEQIPVVEFVTSSISANWPEPLAKPVIDNLVNNPQVKFYEPALRGYLLHEMNAKEWKTSARAVQDVKDEQSPVSTLARFLVSRGGPGFSRIL
jgi:alkaline phosphatase D